ncbi:hypothetical protein R69658_07739 [Paraburkholderia aspalathi]|uniref:Stability/partitioning determinant n=1 Tax=Paraburkholderia aspalathi TaxID=1324617 RepID=A0ABM8T7B8_9BURK|nr:hypothetical protein [Paraburkholderia aspalathi]MBK3824034.1 stability/partitioning determinant [Paraburkholderia aspalathi]MBK3835876.1 stability/partitioning determinant [Paraburkholderia aspalathi]MBK3865652.1 stability/partitioning determinant [Paraburkholderia aspalathi]CAE6863713.1 hypothetical protein R69658_07739 [Paraburkholderia aspalathi]
MTRVNPLDDLADFAPKTSGERQNKALRPDVIDRIAADNNFPSRQPVAPAPRGKQPRRYVTGRNQQINIKATAETIAKLYQVADDLGVPLGEVLARALEALEQNERN